MNEILAQQSAVCRIPEPDDAILAGGRELSAVWSEDRGQDRGNPGQWRAERLPGRQVPALRLALGAEVAPVAGQQDFAVRAEGDWPRLLQDQFPAQVVCRAGCQPIAPDRVVRRNHQALAVRAEETVPQALRVFDDLPQSVGVRCPARQVGANQRVQLRGHRRCLLEPFQHPEQAFADLALLGQGDALVKHRRRQHALGRVVGLVGGIAAFMAWPRSCSASRHFQKMPAEPTTSVSTNARLSSDREGLRRQKRQARSSSLTRRARIGRSSR